MTFDHRKNPEVWLADQALLIEHRYPDFFTAFYEKYQPKLPEYLQGKGVYGIFNIDTLGANRTREALIHGLSRATQRTDDAFSSHGDQRHTVFEEAVQAVVGKLAKQPKSVSIRLDRVHESRSPNYVLEIDEWKMRPMQVPEPTIVADKLRRDLRDGAREKIIHNKIQAYTKSVGIRPALIAAVMAGIDVHTFGKAFERGVYKNLDNDPDFHSLTPVSYTKSRLMLEGKPAGMSLYNLYYELSKYYQGKSRFDPQVYKQLTEMVAPYAIPTEIPERRAPSSAGLGYINIEKAHTPVVILRPAIEGASRMLETFSGIEQKQKDWMNYILGHFLANKATTEVVSAYYVFPED